MPDTLYDVLGVSRQATQVQIRAAYRRLVIRYHPDQAGEQADLERFYQARDAYEALADPERRREYDRLLDLRAERQARRQAGAPPHEPRAEPTTPKRPPREADQRAQIAEDLSRLMRMYARGAYAETERLARQIVERDPRQATPYAVLGDLARAKGNLGEASKMYAFAAQMDPRNPAYQRKHEELLGRLHARPRPDAPMQGAGAAPSSGLAAPVCFGLVLLAAAYVALAQEPSAFGRYAWISSWTFGLVVMLFLAGVSLGAGLSLAGHLDRFEAMTSNALNRVSPALALASVAIVNFWAAVFLYALVGGRAGSHTYSMSRLIAGVGGALGVMALAAGGSASIQPVQVLIWGGNLIYAGAVSGWMVADALRE